MTGGLHTLNGNGTCVIYNIMYVPTSFKLNIFICQRICIAGGFTHIPEKEADFCLINWF